MTTGTLADWRSQFWAVQEVRQAPPKWVIPGLLPPGLTLLFGDPKTFKSTLVLNMIAAIAELQPIGPAKLGRVASKKGSAAYFAAEQSAGTLRHAYETGVLRRKLPDRNEKGPVSLNFLIAKDPWDWQLDGEDEGKRFVDFIRDARPTLIVLDPFVHFHQMDENDPRVVRPLVPLRQAVLSYGGSLVVVHHARKAQPGAPRAGPGSSGGDFSRVRGTSALWAMADAGLMTHKASENSVNIIAEFKDWPATTWTWKPRP